VYNMLINMFTQRGDVEKSLNLIHQMQMDFDSEKNQNCCPDIHTYNIVNNGSVPYVSKYFRGHAW
jgi:pentatricopeptide repeat protein